MNIRAVLMDVDGTMTGYKNTGAAHRSPLYLLESLVMEKFGLERPEATGKILSCGDCDVYCLSEFLDQLQIPQEQYFRVLYEDLKKYLYVTDDTKFFFRFLKEKHVPLYSATTNSEFMTRAKLAAGGVEADMKKCEWFTGYYSGCFFRDPLGKFSPDFYSSILKHGNFNPAEVMMVGDEPERDMLPAMRAGIKYGITVDRTQKEPVIQKDGGYYVNSMTVLQDFFDI